MDEKEREIVCVCNFTPVHRENYKIGVSRSGTYEVVFNSDDEEFGGEGKGSKGKIKSAKKPLHSFENSIALDLPGNSVIYLKAPIKRKPKSTNKSSKEA